MDKESADSRAAEAQVNRYALFIEEAGGMEKIHDCQNNANEEIYMKAYNIIESAHQFWLMMVLDWIIGRAEYKAN